MKQLALTLLVVSVILLSACSCPSAPEKTAFSPKSPVPADYTTYTDEASIFSIAYPPDWEIALTLIEDVKFQEYMQRALEASEADISSLASMVAFLVGIPTGKGGYSPNVSVTVLSLPSKTSRLDDIVEATIRQSKDLSTEYEVLKRVRTTVNGVEAVIMENKAYYPSMEPAHQLQLTMLKNKVIWYVTCTSKLDEFAKYEDDFYHIVMSFRILK